jgi:hypothetical protein
MVHEALQQPGRQLDSSIRSQMEPRFGRDFSNVRVHTDEKAALSARAVGASAYSVGSDIVFGGGQFAPSTAAGKSLLAHELTHTLQQPSRTPGAELTLGDAASPAEREAETAAQSVGAGAVRTLGHAALHVIHRQPGPAKGTTPADYGISLVVIDHGATSAAAAARARLNEIYSHVQPANLSQLKTNGITTIEMHVIPEDRKIVDLPEFKHLKGTMTPDGRLWDDVRGEGGVQSGSTIRYAVGEESLVGSHHHGWAIGLSIGAGVGLGALGAGVGSAVGGKDSKNQLIGGLVGGGIGLLGGAIGGFFLGKAIDKSGEGYAESFVASHETAHTVELYALPPAQQIRLQTLYDARLKAGGPWLDPADYTKSNIHEYWAQCSAAFFRRPYQDSDADTYTPEWLQKNDPDMYKLLVEVYGSPAAEAGRHASVETPPAQKAAA